MTHKHIASIQQPARRSTAARASTGCLRFVTGLLFVLLGVSSVLAQTVKIDSLKHALPGTTGKDRLAVLYALANALEGIYPQQGLDYAREGMPLAEHLADTASLATLYASASFSSTELGDFKQAMDYAYRSLDLATRIGDKKRIATGHSTIGMSYVYIGQFSKALEHHFEALRLREELALTVPIGVTLNNIGVVYHRIGQYEKSITYYKRSFERQGSHLSALGSVRLLTNIGYSEYKRGRLDTAMAYLDKARDIAERSRILTSLAYIYFNLGNISADKKNTSASVDYLNRALAYYDSLGQKGGILQVLNALGRTYFKIGNYDRSRAYLQRAVALGTRINAPDQIKASYETLYQMYEKTGPEKLAYRYLKLYSEAKDSLINSVESKKIAELAIQHAAAANEHEIELLKKEKTISELNLEKQKYHTNLIVGVVLLLFVVIAFMVVYNRSARRSRRRAEESNEALKVMNIELQEKIVEIKALSGLLPICASCKKIRDDKGYWEQLEGYISKHSDATFSHGICPDCMETLYPKYIKRK